MKKGKVKVPRFIFIGFLRYAVIDLIEDTRAIHLLSVRRDPAVHSWTVMFGR